MSEPTNGIRYDCADGIAVITLARPERRNSFTLTMIDEWIQVLRTAEADSAVRVVVITGEGSAFCAGADLGEIFEEDPTPMGRKDRLAKHIQQVGLAREPNGQTCHRSRQRRGGGRRHGHGTDVRLSDRCQRGEAGRLLCQGGRDARQWSRALPAAHRRAVSGVGVAAHRAVRWTLRSACNWVSSREWCRATSSWPKQWQLQRSLPVILRCSRR